MKIALQNIFKTFGEAKALASVSFEVRDGECFFLLGPSGCGKTTVLRVIAGFCPADSGSVLFNNEPVNDLAPHLRNTGMVFQNYALWPHLSVAENVEFGLTVPSRHVPKSERVERVREMLSLLHLSGMEERAPSQLSGGQQQRVALARALIIKPACLLLDEPLSNLDAKLRMEMRLEIRRVIKQLGITAIYVTHDQVEALCMADRCAIMRGGMVEQIGSPRELFERPISRFTADFMGYTNFFKARVVSRDSGALRLSTSAGEWVSEADNHPFPEGASVILAVRPEKIRLGGQPAGAPNVFQGRLKEAIYLGSAFEYRVELSGALTIDVLQPASDFCAEPGEPASIQVDPRDVVVLPG